MYSNKLHASMDITSSFSTGLMYGYLSLAYLNHFHLYAYRYNKRIFWDATLIQEAYYDDWFIDWSTEVIRLPEGMQVAGGGNRVAAKYPPPFAYREKLLT